MKWKNLLSEASLYFGNDLPESIYSQTILDKSPLPFRNYYFIFDCALGHVHSISPQLTEVLGYCENQFTIEQLFKSIHSDDKDIFIAHETQALEFCKQLKPEKQNKYKIVHDYRLQTKDGTYLRVLQQTYVYEMRNGLVKKTLVIYTDISHIKRTERPALHIIGWDGEPSYYNISQSTDNFQSKIHITKRELEIVKLIDMGNSSRIIAEMLQISYYTVLNHRKNVLKKTATHSTPAMLKKLKESNIL